VAERILVQSPGDIWSAVKYPWNLVQVAAHRPRVINISAATNVPAVPAAAAKPALSAITGLLRLAGVLVVAAAGNDGLDLDEEDCFIVCWHKRTAIPCELGNVLCVGALAWNSRDKASYSNWGSNVDLFAPGGIWVLDNIDVLRQLDATTGNKSVHLFRPAPAVRSVDPGIVIDYYLPKTPAKLTIDVLDSSGKVIRTFVGAAEKPKKEGEDKVKKGAEAKAAAKPAAPAKDASKAAAAKGDAAKDVAGKTAGKDAAGKDLPKPVVIDWTNLLDFYGKLGFRIWRTYRQGAKEL
jgi:subtilisin family serine protease